MFQWLKRLFKSDDRMIMFDSISDAKLSWKIEQDGNNSFRVYENTQNGWAMAFKDCGSIGAAKENMQAIILARHNKARYVENVLYFDENGNQV